MERTRNGRAGIFLGLLLTLLTTVLMLFRIGPLETLEDKLLDYRYRNCLAILSSHW